MAEDQSEPGASAKDESQSSQQQQTAKDSGESSTVNEVATESSESKDKQEGSQEDNESIKLELDDPEETSKPPTTTAEVKDKDEELKNEEQPIKNDEGEKDKETDNKDEEVLKNEVVEVQVDAGSSKEAADDKEKEEEPKKDEKEVVEEKPKEELPPEKITEEPEKPAEEPKEEEKEEKLATKEEEDKEEVKKTKESSAEEVGIVGPPKAVSELLSEAELGPTLPTVAPKIADRVSRWVENTAAAANSAKVDEPDDVDDIVEEVEAEEELLNEEEVQKNKQKVDNGKDGNEIVVVKRPRGRPRKQSSNGTGDSPTTRKAQKMVSNIIRRSIRCLNKMHAMDGSGVGKNSSSSEKGRGAENDEESRKSPKVPQSQQNGAALPEEAASADRSLLHCQSPAAVLSKKEKKDAESNEQDSQVTITKTIQPKPQLTEQTTTNRVGRPRGSLSSSTINKASQPEDLRDQARETRKRRSIDSSNPNTGANGSSTPKKICLDQREQYISSLMGISDKFTVDQLSARAEQLRSEVQDLDELARAKEMEWNEILSMRKLKEEAYLRLERRRQILGFMESNGSEGVSLPPASLALLQQNFDHRGLLVPKEESKRDRASKAAAAIYQQAAKLENGPRVDAQSPEHRQIGEGRQGPIVDVRSIIADYRLRHPETVPRRRGRRMRNSVNVGLGAGGAMVETVGNMDSRPSSTDSCKSNPNINDPNNAMSFKDVLVQFAKLSQQQGEPIKTPQNYPDVTLHPVAAPQPQQQQQPVAQQQQQQQQPNSTPQPSGSLLHGILTKSQSPRPTTFSPTLARLLTAPERERSSAASITPTPHQTATQHLLQAYQGANPVSINDFLSSTKARTEITITPVVNNPIQTHSNNAIHIDDVEEETSIIDERDSRLSINTRDNRDDRDSPPRCQGCHERAAQFVCAGCGNQWYCSRECQVAAWDDHSDACSP